MDSKILDFILFALIFVHDVDSRPDSSRLFLKPNISECLKREIHKDVDVSAEYTFGKASGQRASIQVTDSRGSTLFKREDFVDLFGNFSFATSKHDIFDICFISKVSQGTISSHREVHMTIKLSPKPMLNRGQITGIAFGVVGLVALILFSAWASSRYCRERNTSPPEPPIVQPPPVMTLDQVNVFQMNWDNDGNLVDPDP